jgi:hypothetical protein
MPGEEGINNHFRGSSRQDYLVPSQAVPNGTIAHPIRNEPVDWGSFEISK